VITLSDLFTFDYSAGIDADGRFAGMATATGLRPRFAEQLHDFGIDLAPELFDGEQQAARAWIERVR
jgi:pilus assembly protein CpaF